MLKIKNVKFNVSHAKYRGIVNDASIPGWSPEMHVNEFHLPDKTRHEMSSLMKFHQNTQNYIKYEVYVNV